MSIIKESTMHYCPGCGHNIIKDIIADIAEKMKIEDKMILLTSAGCSIILSKLLDCDIVECAHGRAPAVATGIKRALPESIVITYQGDGDLASIGIAEIIHAANRGENISVIFANNAIYSMTGGQAAPTTIPGQKTTTTPHGSTAAPLKICELLSGLEGAAYLERTSIDSQKDIMRTKNAIIKALKNQEKRRGLSLVEILSPCPTAWKMSPKEAFEFIDRMKEHFPLGKIKGD